MGIFGEKPIKTIGVGEWDFEWYYDDKNVKKSRLVVRSTDGAFELRIPGTAHAYGYLLAAAQQEQLDQLHGWITMVFAVETLTVTDQGLSDDVTKAITKWQKRMYKRADKIAKAVTDVELQADEALMEDIITERSLSPKELKKKRAEDKKIIREILTEKNNDRPTDN